MNRKMAITGLRALVATAQNLALRRAMAEVLDEYERGFEAEDFEVQRERAHLAGMEFGVEGYNDVMGYDLSEPEPCGHHCPSDCPRCGSDR